MFFLALHQNIFVLFYQKLSLDIFMKYWISCFKLYYGIFGLRIVGSVCKKNWICWFSAKKECIFFSKDKHNFSIKGKKDRSHVLKWIWAKISNFFTITISQNLSADQTTWWNPSRMGRRLDSKGLPFTLIYVQSHDFNQVPRYWEKFPRQLSKKCWVRNISL